MPTRLSPEPFVPTINIAPFLANPHSDEAEDVVESVRNACREPGFFQVVGHGIPLSYQHDLFAAAKKFFDLPQSEKSALDASKQVGRRGYDVLASQSYHLDTLPDLKEGFYVGPDLSLDHPAVQAKRFFMGPNVWPKPDHLAQDQFRAPVETYFHAINTLAIRILGLIERTLPHGPGIFEDFTKDPAVSVLRVLHYPPAPPPNSAEGKKQFGAGAHADFGAITLLLQDDHAGLEVLDLSTGEFVPVDPTPDALVFNVGNMLSNLTGGEYRSAVHRVINKAPTDRYSAAFFYDGALDCPLAPFGSKDTPANGKNGEVLTVEQHMIKCITDSYSTQK